jgi:hypothetical protein
VAEPGWSHDIKDPEAFVGRVIERSRLELDHARTERLHQFLLIALWELSLNYQSNGKPACFSNIAYRILPKRIIDWERSPEEGGRTRWQFADRTYERDLPGFIEYGDDVVGAAELDPAERVDSDSAGLDSGRAIGASAYLPPRGMFPDRRIRRPSRRETTRKAA